jgi:Protein of unknown function (DUF3014)
MTDLNELKLDKWQGSFEPEPRRKGRILAIVALLLLALGAGIYFLVWRRPVPPAAEVRTATEQAVAPTAPTRPLPEAGEVINLPPIDQTDAIVRELVTRLSSNPTVTAWLTTDKLIRNFTVVVENISTGRSPAGHLGKVRPTGGFQVREDRSGLWIDPRSYRRYDKYADAVAAIDAQGAARLYATLKPRIEDGYRDLGHPDGNVDQAFERALIELLKTPVVDGDVALASKSVSYEYADPKLQSLSSAQRQFLRMGPRNVRLIQAKLREIAPFLGIPPESLPK